MIAKQLRQITAYLKKSIYAPTWKEEVTDLIEDMVADDKNPTVIKNKILALYGNKPEVRDIIKEYNLDKQSSLYN